METGQCQYFSRTVADKLGHPQYFLSKLGYPPRCCSYPRALGSWVTQKWSSPCPAPSGIPAPNFLVLTALGGRELDNIKRNPAHSYCRKLVLDSKGEQWAVFSFLFFSFFYCLKAELRGKPSINLPPSTVCFIV